MWFFCEFLVQAEEAGQKNLFKLVGAAFGWQLALSSIAAAHGFLTE